MHRGSSDQEKWQPPLGQTGYEHRAEEQPDIFRGSGEAIASVPSGLQTFDSTQRMGAKEQRPEIRFAGLAADMGCRVIVEWIGSYSGRPTRFKLCPVLCPPPNPTECYRMSGNRWKALLDKASVAFPHTSCRSVQVIDSSCDQSSGPGGRRFKSSLPDQSFLSPTQYSRMPKEPDWNF